MIKMTNDGIPFKLVLFNHSNINDASIYVLFLFEFTQTQENTVVYVFNER